MFQLDRFEATVRRLGSVFAFAVVAVVLSVAAPAQSVGDCVSLQPKRAGLGIPIHETAGVNSWRGERFPVDAIVRVDATHESGWFLVAGADRQGWVSPRYVGGIVSCDDTHTNSAVAMVDDGVCRVATWNIEWFKNGKTRGFPELQGSKSLPERSEADIAYMARLVVDMGLDILMLQEINGFERELGGEQVTVSPEMERFVTHLDELTAEGTWEYCIGSTGGPQRLVFLWDTRLVGLNWWCEADLPSQKVNGKQLYDRQPILGYFSTFNSGVEMNDFVLVNVHLASGQPRARNHDMAMSGIVRWIAGERNENGCIPPDEMDVVVAGDLNASRFDRYRERFWDVMESDGWDVLADDAALYPGTRVRGGSKVSVIDYMIVSSGSQGLQGEEVNMQMADVRVDLLNYPEINGDHVKFRTRASDHLPVTVDITVMSDTDR